MCGEWLQVIQTVFIVVGVIIAVITLLADHKRRKRQSTLELYNPISEEKYELRNKIRDVFKNKIIDPNDLCYKNDKELQRTITRFLSLYERVSVGINCNVLDLKVFMRIAGKSTIDWYDRLTPVIEKKRNGHTTAYKDFEILVNKMRKKYGKLYSNRYKKP
jgi:hypothetical protein